MFTTIEKLVKTDKKTLQIVYDDEFKAYTACLNGVYAVANNPANLLFFLEQELNDFEKLNK